MLSRAGLEGTLKSQIKEFLVEMLLARFGSRQTFQGYHSDFE